MDNIDTTPSVKFAADSGFRMGSSHEMTGAPCQDYALSSNTSTPFAVVSDGCSMSGHTDFGSRLFARAAASFLTNYGTEPDQKIEETLTFARSVIVTEANASMRALNLSIMDMDATLGFVHLNDEYAITSGLFGDGVLAAKTNRGLEAVMIQWAGNMPGYPSYLLPKADLHEFILQSEQAGVENSIAPFRAEHYLIGDGQVELLSVDERSAINGLKGFGIIWPPETEIAMVLSDGVEQVGDTPWFDVVAMLSALKASRQGNFMQRRLTRTLHDLNKIGRRPIDDISVGALAASINKEL
jgi:hypothetical protein